MVKASGYQSQSTGLAPGTIVHIGEKLIKKPVLKVLSYNEEDVEEGEMNPQDDFPGSHMENAAVTWIRVIGIEDIDLLERVGQQYHIHTLTLEDISNTLQRPKFEDYGDYFFLTVKGIHHQSRGMSLRFSQISILVGERVLISFEEEEETLFEGVRERIVGGKGLLRKKGPDFLAYSLLDAVVDHYFPAFEKIGEEMEMLEEILVADPNKDTVRSIHGMKREMLRLRRSIWPLREVIANLERGVSPLIHETTAIYVRDVYDHVVDMMDVLENYRDMLSGMVDIYLTSVSNRMNEVMKVLTVISTIFIPLTFITSLYGMNFKFMPELGLAWAYPAVLLGMLVMAVLMVLYFRHKKWL